MSTIYIACIHGFVLHQKSCIWYKTHSNVEIKYQHVYIIKLLYRRTQGAVYIICSFTALSQGMVYTICSFTSLSQGMTSSIHTGMMNIKNKILRTTNSSQIWFNKTIWYFEIPLILCGFSSPELKGAFLIVRRPSVCQFVNYIFNFSRTTGPILTTLGTNHP
jgi:hypothetical protein